MFLWPWTGGLVYDTSVPRPVYTGTALTVVTSVAGCLGTSVACAGLIGGIRGLHNAIIYGTL